MLRAVLDTNVIISGIIGHGPPAQILDAARIGQSNLVTSAELMAELEAVAGRPGIVNKYPYVLDNLKAIVDFLSSFSVGGASLSGNPAIVQDPRDVPVLACAVAGKANYIVSGDPHLLNLKEFHSTRIVSPREFMDILGRQRRE